MCDILLYEGADPFLVDYQNRHVYLALRVRIPSNSTRSAVDIAWEAVLTNSKSATKLQNLVAFSSSDKYVVENKMSSLHKCVLGLECLEIKQCLERTPDYHVDEKDTEGQTALYWAARRGDLQAITLLLQAGADKNSANNRGARILTAAIMSSNIDCIWKILRSDCDIKFRQKDGYMPLHHCCRYDTDVSIVKFFLEHGADENAQTALGHTPLMIATFDKRTALAEFLIDSRAKLDIQGKDGGCALYYAVMSGDHRIVHCLLNIGANYLLKTNNGETILHTLAQKNGDNEMIRCLESFDLSKLNVEDITKKQALTALEIAERNPECDVQWLEKFKSLIIKIRDERLRKDLAEAECDNDMMFYSSASFWIFCCCCMPYIVVFFSILFPFFM